MHSNSLWRDYRVGLAVFLAVLAVLGVYTFWDLPPVDSLPRHLLPSSIRITDRNGQLLYEILPQEGGRHAVLSFENLPRCMRDASVAVEDKNFYRNPGVDVGGILRALWINLQGGETLAGGSTITQQVARNLLLGREERFERTLRRKLRETLLAWQLTHRLSKDDILALYLNQIYYGGLAYGVEAAAQTYFGKPAGDLLLPECALLAGLPQAPGTYNPFTHPELAKERQRVVLGLMERQGYITHEQRLAAEAVPLSYNPLPYPIQAPHFVWLIKDHLDALFASGRLDRRQSLVVRTTLDLRLQQLAEQIVARRIAAFRPKAGEIDHNVNNAALVALDPRNGEILALIGSVDYFDASIDGAVDMATSPRQSGSAFKPFIYALALDPHQAEPWTAATPILDVSTTFITRDGSPYVPKNYDGREHGLVSVREALASSLNIPAVRTLQKVGVERTLNLAHHLGITSLGDPQRYDLSLALGGGEMSLLELSTAYAALANGGYYTGHYTVLDIRDADGRLLYVQERTPPLEVFEPRLAWLINDILSDDRARAIGFGMNSTLKLERTAAVKTGTTTNFHDNWTIGYTPALLVGVWVGNSNYEAMHTVSGVTGAAPIWNEVMRAFLQGQPDRPFPRPAGLEQIEVCEPSGLLPTPACPRTRMEWFISGSEPRRADTYYRQILIDGLTGRAANETTPPERLRSVIALDLPLEAQAWARAQGWPLLSDLVGEARSPAARAERVILASPAPNTTYRLARDFDPSAQQILVQALAGPAVVQLAIYADGNPLAQFSAPPYEAWWPLRGGEHRFWAQGRTASGHTLTSEVAIIQVLP